MQFYSKEALQLIFDQVNRDNPDLPVPISDASVALKGAVRATGSGAARNSSAIFVGKPGGGYRGQLTLQFDRVNLSQLYLPTMRPMVVLPATVKTQQDALPYVNDALGVSLTAADLSTPTAAMVATASPVDVSMTILSTSPAFIGFLYFSIQLKPVGYYPNSGPGTKYLTYGDENMGYFGKVDSTELFTKVETMVAIFGSAAYSRYGSTEGWFKFFYKGSVIFIPVEPVGAAVPWNDIYNAGAMYGIDGVGKYPTTTPVNQAKSIPCKKGSKTYYLRPRMPRASLNEPDAYFVGTPGQGNYAGTELDLLSRMYSGGVWGNETSGAWGQWVFFQDTISNNPANCRISNMAARNWSVSAKNTAGFYWLPVLELIDLKNTLVALDNISGKLETSVLHIPATSSQSLIVAPVDLGVPKTIEFQPITATPEPATMELHPLDLGSPKTVDYQPVSATVGNYEIKKSNLGDANGELNGFKG